LLEHPSDEVRKKLDSQFDVILDAVSGNHDYQIYLQLLVVNGKLSPFELVKNRRCIIGSMIGGTDETQEMLDFCAEKNIVADGEVIPMQYINEAYERMLKNDVKYRFVIDMASLK
jgi:alcohol dehydrogenase (NADP+)